MTNIRIVYGTLKSGFRLHEMCGLNNKKIATFLGTAKLPGFDMWTNGSYPLVKEGDGTIEIEAYEIHSEDALKQIDNIEIGAGYKCKELDIKIDDKPVKGNIYLYQGSVEHNDQVMSGNFKRD